jgi:hypothetical protein
MTVVCDFTRRSEDMSVHFLVNQDFLKMIAKRSGYIGSQKIKYTSGLSFMRESLPDT